MFLQNKAIPSTKYPELPQLAPEPPKIIGNSGTSSHSLKESFIGVTSSHKKPWSWLWTMFLKTIIGIALTLSVISLVCSYEVVKKVQDGQKTVIVDGVKKKLTVKKVFITIRHEGYTYRKRKVTGKREDGTYRVVFICSECAKMDRLLYANSVVTVTDLEKEEDDEYVIETFPLQDEHLCQPHGVEVLVAEFNRDLREGVHVNPVRPLPELYETTR